MGTRALVTEQQLMAAIPRNPNPNLGFRGNPDGRQGTALVNYGVYAGPLQRALAHYSYRSDILMFASNAQLQAYIDKGWPLVAWVTYLLQPAVPRLAQAGDGSFVLVPHEHAVLVVGYSQSAIIAHDPWSGTQVTYSWHEFDRAWGYFGDMGLAIEPCALPAPVQRLHAVLVSSSAIRWAWSGSAPAGYRVTVTLPQQRNAPIVRRTVSVHHFVMTQPVANTVYEIAVQAVSDCGALSRPQRLVVQSLPVEEVTPVSSPSPIPTQAPGGATAVPTPTG